MDNTSSYPSELGSFLAMHWRCKHKGSSSYPYYGGRGIKVCDQWKSFEQFLVDMGPKPTPKHTIERKDSNGNYEPDNCKWATRLEQARNRSGHKNARKLEAWGRVQSMTQWAKEFGMPTEKLRQRLLRGYPLEESLTATDLRKRKPSATN